MPAMFEEITTLAGLVIAALGLAIAAVTLYIDLRNRHKRPREEKKARRGYL